MNCDGELFMNFSSWTNNASILWTFHELFMNVHEQFIKSWTTFHRESLCEGEIQEKSSPQNRCPSSQAS